MLKLFVANITTQVIERRIMRGLESIFSPVAVNELSDSVVELIAIESPSSQRQRTSLGERIKKLENGQRIFYEVMGGALA